MMESPGLLWTVACFILVIGPLVFVHEMGHFLAARWCGVQVEAFSIGFGREVVGWTDRHGTRWKVAWMPLGGYVRFAGDMNGASMEDNRWRQLPPDQQERVFHAKPLWQRAFVVFAGPLANFIAAIAILSAFAVAYGEGKTPAVIEILQQGSPADKAGLRIGDRITRINDRSVASFDEIYPIIQDRPGEKLDLTLERAERTFDVAVIPSTVVEKDRFGNVYRIGRIGIGSSTTRVTVPVPFYKAPFVAVRQTSEILDRMVTGIWQLVTGRRSVGELGGPIKIAQISGQAATLGWQEFVYLVALISINLGFINLLPVPMLDGGHLSFYAVEAIQRRPVSPKTMELAFRSGMYVLLALMVFVTLNDLGSLGLWRLAGLDG